MDFLQDKPSRFIINRNPLASGYRSLEAAWYVQDEIKLLPNLTLRIGLRDEMTNGWNEVAGRCSNYVFDRDFVIQTNPVVGNSCFQSNQAKALWQPRVGVAWDPTGTGTWAVRAGFGIHNDLIDNLAIRVYPNPPTNAREQFTTPLLSLYPLQRGGYATVFESQYNRLFSLRTCNTGYPPNVLSGSIRISFQHSAARRQPGNTTVSA